MTLKCLRDMIVTYIMENVSFFSRKIEQLTIKSKGSTYDLKNLEWQNSE